MINALFDLLGMFYQSGDFVQAEWMARSVLLAIPDDIVSLQLLGLVYYRTERSRPCRHSVPPTKTPTAADIAMSAAACSLGTVPAGGERPWIGTGRRLV
jgi:hypothetical protein